MILINLKREAPWFFHYIENYNHLFFNIRLTNTHNIKEETKFSLELNLQGYEGLIFYLYKENYRKLNFGLYKHSVDQIHNINDLNLVLDQGLSNSLDFVIVPFGYFKDEPKFNVRFDCDELETSFDIYAWESSSLFKNLKSVIRIDNQYNELIPIDDYKGYYYQIERSFKGNQTGRLFDLVNLLLELDKSRDELNNETLFEPMDREIKTLVSKTNEFLFELCHTSIPLEMKSLLRELERLKFNVDNLSKEEIFNWLDNLVDFYS